MKHLPSRFSFFASVLTVIVLTGVPLPAAGQADLGRSWQAGDHHIHSRYSENYNHDTDPPTPVSGTDAEYPIPVNAMMAQRYGLSWMVSTDHGGPGHSAFNLKRAYPELRKSRELVPDVLQFYGMEFDVPGANHASLIIPRVTQEDSMLYEIERRFGEREVYPRDAARETNEKMIEALEYMEQLPQPPLLFVNHPSRSAKDLGVYGANTPQRLRSWNDVAPSVSTGMEGAPGHQARISPDGTVRPNGDRGSYDDYPTMGGFDQMTARVGGVWDALLGEGRRWWVTSTSDLHYNWRDGGGDFWPGEYSKTYVYADETYDDVLDGLRNGRVFVTLGDLISDLNVQAEAEGVDPAAIGGTLRLPEEGADVLVTIRLRDPEAPNHHGDTPRVRRVDLIVGQVTGSASDPSQDTNTTTRVAHRFTEADWTREGEYLTMTYRLEDVSSDHYVRVRGTNTSELEPEVDPLGEDPWSDLWFYANPIFLEVQ